ncbi:MAG TPA: carboxylating nicotinate-nucleotide diphosphorylase [Terriglobales bacterium]|nr:carboxylating nicotinate-nucleotide diphosphorylase [Terriglobales bacterium]
MDWHSRRISSILENALLEDKATSDATSRACIDAQQRATATILAKQECVLAGVGAVARILEIYEQLDREAIGHPEVISHGEIFDGVRLHKGQAIAVVRHNARVLLCCERVILNVLQRLSGIATYTRQFVDAIHGTNARILDTRKTVPGLRVLDKYAVRCGGGHNHRLDLSDGMLLKNNHVALAGSLSAALQKALRNRRSEMPVEVEVRNMQELEEALSNGAERIMLDNMTVEQVKNAVARIRTHSHPVPIEVSGGIRLDNVRAYAETGVDYISVGALTHSPPAVDLSMRIVPA